jgi:hypothetical protein
MLNRLYSKTLQINVTPCNLQEARKVGKGCKITALYVARQNGSFVDLADDR